MRMARAECLLAEGGAEVLANLLKSLAAVAGVDLLH